MSEKTESPPGGEEPTFEMPEMGLKADSGDGMLAAIILGAAIAIVIIGGLIYRQWGNGGKGGSASGDGLEWMEDTSGFSAVKFEEPKERQEYIDARPKIDTKKPEDLVKLKKMLMVRSLKTIPLLYELQNGGPSVDRLYKKGMLTDAHHNRFKELKAYVDAEFADVQKEAEELVSGWGSIIWPQANQYYQIQTGQGKDADKEDEDEDGDSIVKALSATAKTVSSGDDGSGSGSGSGKAGGGKKASKKAAADPTKGMTEEQKAEYHASQLMKEENKSQGKKKKGGK